MLGSRCISSPPTSSASTLPAASSQASRHDVVLTITEMLRKAKVVGKFVEFFGEGAAALPVTDRATIPTCARIRRNHGLLPGRRSHCQYFAATGRTAAQVDLIRAYYQAQGLFGIPKAGEIDYSQTLGLDLSTVEPRRRTQTTQDRIALSEIETTFDTLMQSPRRRRLRQDRRRPAPHLRGRSGGELPTATSSSRRSPRAPTPPTPA